MEGQVGGAEVPRRGPGLAPPPQDLDVVRLAGRPQPRNRTTGAPAVERIAAVRSSDLNAPRGQGWAAIRSRIASTPAIGTTSSDMRAPRKIPRKLLSTGNSGKTGGKSPNGNRPAQTDINNFNRMPETSILQA